MNPRGFTLIELLVVLAILAILMSITIPGAGVIMRNLRKAQARSDAISIATLLSTYHSEYNHWPAWDGIDKNGVNSTDDAFVSIMSCATPNGGPLPQKYRPYNVKLIKFWTPDSAVLNPRGAFPDPWGNLYCFMFDADGDGHVSIPDSTLDPIPASVIVWSLGPNGMQDHDEKSDDVHSW